MVPKPVVKWVCAIYFQWWVFAGPLQFAQTEVESDSMKELANIGF